MDIIKIKSAVSEWEKSQQNQVSAYEYEKTFDQMWQDLGSQVLQSSLGELPTDKNKKNANE